MTDLKSKHHFVVQLLNRYDRAKEKHPKTSFHALVSEVGELCDAIINLNKESSHYCKQRVKDEAIDVAVVAMRIAQGEIF